MWLYVHGVLEEFLGAVKKAAPNSCVICCEKQSRDGSTAVSSPDAGCCQGDTIQISPFASQSLIILSLQRFLVLLK
jgi:hypothetical protein